MLPVSKPGFRVNLQAALFGSLLAMFVYLIIADTLRSKDGISAGSVIASAAAALSFGFSYTLWSQSLSAKGGIYTLNSCMLAMIMLSFFKWERTRQYKYFYLGVFLFGLSLGNHWESMAVAFPALFTFIVLVFLKDGYYKTITWKRVLTAFGLGLSALMVYAYLVIRARSNTFLNWGDPVDLKQLFWVVTRAEYTSLEQAKDLQVIIKQVSRISWLVFTEFSAAGFLLVMAGTVGFLKTGRKQRFVMFCVLPATVLASLSSYLNLKDEMMWIMDVFLLPVYLTMAVFLGIGIDYILKIVDGRMRNRGPVKSAFLNLISSIAVLLPVYLCVTNFYRADQSRYYFAYDLGMNMIKSVDEPGSIAMLEGDFAVLPQMYFKYVEKTADFCPVTTIFLYVPWSLKNLRNDCPGVRFTVNESASLGDKIKNVVAENYKDSAIYTSVFRTTFEQFYPQANAMLTPAGMLMKLSPDRPGTLKRAIEKLHILSYRNLLGGGVYMDTTTRLGMSNYSSIFMETGNALSAQGNDGPALKYLTEATQIATSQTRGISYTHLGVQYAKMKLYDKAAENYGRAIEENPLQIEAYANLAGLYNNEKKYDKAMELCEKAMAIDPTNAEVYNNLALAYYYKGNAPKAVELLEKSVSLKPDNAVARQNLEIIKGMKK